MTADEGPEPEPRVHCPRCGKRFRVDPASLADRADGAPARCSGCRTGFRVRRTPTGSIEVVEAGSSIGGADAKPRHGQRRRERPPPGPANRAKRSGARPRASVAAATEEASGLGSGERIGRYEIEALLGRGGMGAVYRAFDPAANRHVALKVLSAGASQADRSRFRREVEVQGNIHHPHIMPILDSGTRGRSRYFAMELLRDPVDLAELVALSRRGVAVRDPYLRAAATLRGVVECVLLPICQAIHHANVREGVLHRDLKPENVLVDRNGLRPYVIDFGVCSLLERKNRRLAHLPSETPERVLGGKVRVTGTLLYMPPEQARGEVDRRGDVWALGAILHHVLTGAAPYEPATRANVSVREQTDGLRMLIDQARREGNRADEREFQAKLDALEAGSGRTLEDLQRDVLAGHVLPRPASTRRALDAIAEKAMAADPERRYRHALELHDDLRAWLDGRPVRALVERRGPFLGPLYRTGLLLRRHRKAVALLVVAGGLGAWGATSVFDRGGPASPPPVGEGERQETLREAVDAEILERAASEYLPAVRARAEAARHAFANGHWSAARYEVFSLANLLASGLLDPLRAEGTDVQRAELAALERLASGERALVVEPGTRDGGVHLEAVPVDEVTGLVLWPRPESLDGEDPALGYGRWILHAIGKGTVCWLVEVAPGDEPLAVAAPTRPADVPEGRVYVLGGRVRGPLGEAAVGPLLWDRTEVTAARYAAFLETLSRPERARRVPRTMGAPGAPDRILWEQKGDRFVPPPDAARRPVEGISLHDARAFAKHAGGRLPSAAEWAWAATGPLGLLCPLGPVWRLREIRADAPEAGPAPVGTAAVDQTAFGLRDMAGNLAEFTGTLATLHGTSGWLVMGAGYRTSPGRALVTEAMPVPGWQPHLGVGFRVVYETR